MSTFGTSVWRARLREVASSIRVPDVPVEMAEEVPGNRPRRSCRFGKCDIYHEDNGTKLELENGEVSCDAR